MHSSAISRKLNVIDSELSKHLVLCRDRTEEGLKRVQRGFEGGTSGDFAKERSFPIPKLLTYPPWIVSGMETQDFIIDND